MQKHGLDISFPINPVPPYDGPDPCYADENVVEWDYTTIVTETNGVGVTITGISWDFYDQYGDYLNTQWNSGADFADWFGNDYLDANSNVSSEICTDLGDPPSGSIVMTFYGFDNQGREIFGSGEIILSSGVYLAPSTMSLQTQGTTARRLPVVKSKRF